MSGEATTVERIAAFVHQRGEADLSAEARDRLNRSLLDTLGCAIGAIGHPPVGPCAPWSTQARPPR